MGDPRPAGSYASAESHQYSSACDGSMQAETPHSQVRLRKYMLEGAKSVEGLRES